MPSLSVFRVGQQNLQYIFTNNKTDINTKVTQMHKDNKRQFIQNYLIWKVLFSTFTNITKMMFKKISGFAAPFCTFTYQTSSFSKYPASQVSNPWPLYFKAGALFMHHSVTCRIIAIMAIQTHMITKLSPWVKYHRC